MWIPTESQLLFKKEPIIPLQQGKAYLINTLRRHTYPNTHILPKGSSYIKARDKHLSPPQSQNTSLDYQLHSNKEWLQKSQPPPSTRTTEPTQWQGGIRPLLCPLHIGQTKFNRPQHSGMRQTNKAREHQVKGEHCFSLVIPKRVSVWTHWQLI